MNRFLPALAAGLFLTIGVGYPPMLSAQNQPCTPGGVVQSIRYGEVKGEASGLGMIAGGVVGGVVGHQIGSGRGNTVATIAGAAGGAYVGNEVEKKKNT